jgi:hypothetical protein
MSDHVARMTAEWSPGRAVNEERLAAPLHSIDCGTAYRGCAPGCPKDQAEPRCHCGAYATSDDGKTCCEPGHEARLAAKLASAPPAEAKGDQHCRWGICALPHTELTREEFATAINRMAVSAHGIAKVLAHDDSLRARASEAEEREAKWRRELSAAYELSERAREIVVSALNQPPEHYYDKHDNGEWSAEHIAFAIRSLFRERDEAREQRDDLSRENKGLRDQRDAISDQREDLANEILAERAARLRAEAERDEAAVALASLLLLLPLAGQGLLEERLAAAEAEVKRLNDVVDGHARDSARAGLERDRAEHRLKLATEEIVRVRLAYDDPSLDATDGAHPAWWRGSDAGVAGAVRIVNEALDGPLPLAGCVGGADLEAVRQRAAALRARAQRLEKAGDALVCRIDPDGYGRPALAAWAAAKEQK